MMRNQAGLVPRANSMIAMDGTLELRSEGKGLGARAVLTLKAAPMLREEKELAA